MSTLQTRYTVLEQDMAKLCAEKESLIQTQQNEMLLRNTELENAKKEINHFEELICKAGGKIVVS